MWISLHKTWGLAFYKLAMVWCTKVRAGSLEHTKAVLGDGGLVAAFPLAYAVLICALYAPIPQGCWRWFFAASPFNFAGVIRRVAISGIWISPAAR